VPRSTALDLKSLLAGVGEEQRPARVVDCRPLDVVVEMVASPSELSHAHEQVLAGTLRLAQSLAGADGRVAGLALVTRGAQAAGSPAPEHLLAQSPVWGLARTLRLEHPELHVASIDLDPARESLQQAEALARSLLDAAHGEDELAYRDGTWHMRRLVRRRALTPDHSIAVRLDIAERGAIDRVMLRRIERAAPGPGEVAIDVEAAGLNFRDVLNVLGMYPGDAGPLGHECTGTIAALGAGVEGLQVGEPVVAVATACLASFALAPAALVVRRPAGVSATAAATLPIAFMTARYALETLARIRKGDRVLIHAAAGGVGLAAVQIAHLAGAEVFATAGSEEKHAALRALGVRHVMSSRTLTFASELQALTAGRGVDVVLNSLAGEFIPHSLDSLAPGGRFVEIGRTGIWDPAAVAERRPDVAYHVLYLGGVIEREPSIGHALLVAVMDDVGHGRLRPLPTHEFALDRAAEAFRFMAQARHIGKIVLRPARARAEVRADATYLITGGLGALGLAAAAGLARAGARHLVLAGRHAPDAAAEGRIAALRAQGVEVVVSQTDVSREEAVRALVAMVGATMPPLVGVVHAAGVVDDGVVMRQSWERFVPVLAAKAIAAWNLHVATRTVPLECFVMFSSVAGLMGSAGQANYAAANVFLDALADVRRRLGLAGLAIQWGAWAGAGMAAALGGAERRRWATLGAEEIEPAAGVDVMIDLMFADAANVAVMPMSWQRYADAFATGRTPRLMSDVVESETRPVARTQIDADAPTFDSVLKEAPVARRLPMLVRFVTEQALATLGLPASHVLDPRQGLRDVGLDSLMAVELRNRLQDAVHQPLPTTVAFDYPTATALAEYLGERVLGLDLRTPTLVSPAADTAAIDVDSMSDDEAEELLRRELALLDGRESGRR
jgi:NADPH:quinone reductase-like Zn-dependent oxidoreductase